MANDELNEKSKKPLSRAEFRKQQQAEFEQRDKKRVEVEREYAKHHRHQEPDDDFVSDHFEPDVDDQSETLVTRKQAHTKTPDEKISHLKKKLNWAILWLTLAIIIVYLILFFVG
jgi:preprotein translocase subunit SecF